MKKWIAVAILVMAGALLVSVVSAASQATVALDAKIKENNRLLDDI